MKKYAIITAFIIICATAFTSNPKKTKTNNIIFAVFENKNDKYNKWLSKSIPRILIQHFKHLPGMNVKSLNGFIFNAKKTNLDITPDIKSAQDIINKTNTDYLIYGDYISTGSYKNIDSKITLNIKIAAKNNPIYSKFNINFDFKDIHRAIKQVCLKINKIIGKKTNIPYLSYPIITNSKSFIHLISGINNYERKDYPDAIERLQKAISTNKNYLDLAIRYITLSYIKLIDKSKNRKLYKNRKTNSGAEKNISYGRIKSKAIRHVYRLIKRSTPAFFHMGKLYFHLKRYKTALEIWQRLLRMQKLGGTTLNWAKSFSSRPSTAFCSKNEIFVGTRSGILYSLDLFSGKKKWHYKTMKPVQCTPFANENRIYIMSGSYPATLSTLYCFNKKTGLPVYSKTFSGAPSSTPVIIKNILIAGAASGSGNFVAYDKKTGKLLWRRRSFFAKSIETDGKFIYPLFKKYTKYSDEIKNTLSVAKIDPVSGKPVWVFNAEVKTMPHDHSPQDKKISLGKNNVFFISGNNLIVVDKKTGKLRKQIVFPFILRYVLYHEGMIYVAQGEQIHAINFKTGKIIFTFQGNGILSYPAVKNGVLFFGTTDKILYGIDCKTGKYKFQFKTNGEIYFPPDISSGNTLLLSSHDGALYNISYGKKVFYSGAHRSEIIHNIVKAYIKLGQVEMAADYLQRIK